MVDNSFDNRVDRRNFLKKVFFGLGAGGAVVAGIKAAQHPEPVQSSPEKKLAQDIIKTVTASTSVPEGGNTKQEWGKWPYNSNSEDTVYDAISKAVVSWFVQNNPDVPMSEKLLFKDYIENDKGNSMAVAVMINSIDQDGNAIHRIHYFSTPQQLWNDVCDNNSTTDNRSEVNSFFEKIGQSGVVYAVNRHGLGFDFPDEMKGVLFTAHTGNAVLDTEWSDFSAFLQEAERLKQQQEPITYRQ